MRILVIVLLCSGAFGCATLERYAPVAGPICRIFAGEDVCDAVEAVGDVVEEIAEDETE